jgi:hypothetical protein
VGDKFKVMYYQDDRIKEGTEPILPVCATYYELVKNCMSRDYDFYQGPSRQYYVDHHTDKDRTFKSFVYQYNKQDPYITSIEEISGAPYELTYRILNE